MIEFRNPVFNAQGTVDLEINHATEGWIPFTASPDDVEEHSRAIYARAIRGEVALYSPPPGPTPDELREAMKPLNPAQIRLALDEIGITEAMVEAHLAGDTKALIEWRTRPSYRRLHPLVVRLSEPDKFDLPAEQVDTLWLWAAEL